MVGQSTIQERIQKSTIDSFPRSLMLVGELGSGKHTIASLIADKFGLPQENITDNLTLEYIDELYTRVTPYQYIIDMDKISVKEQNTILKFLEEPLKNSFIVLIVENEGLLLQTITNRCNIWRLQNYTELQLKEFLTVDNPLILKLATTPGMVKTLSEAPLQEMNDLADKIINNIDRASLSNALTLTKHFSFKAEQDKFDLIIFMRLMLYKYCERWKAQSSAMYNLNASLLVHDCRCRLNVPHVDVKSQFELFIIKLYKLVRGYTQ